MQPWPLAIVARKASASGFWTEMLTWELGAYPQPDPLAQLQAGAAFGWNASEAPPRCAAADEASAIAVRKATSERKRIAELLSGVGPSQRRRARPDVPTVRAP